MAYYINAAAASGELQTGINELIPAPDLRRRMSRVVKAGVAAAMECVAKMPEGEEISAIITATGLGCLADSEKFLRNIIENDERLLNPTPFIQSTFNTVGAQVALLTGNHGYNMTYSHGGQGFESAMLDAMIRIDENGAKNVLVGAFDERTPTLRRIMERTKVRKYAPQTETGESEEAYFFIISAEPRENCLGELVSLEFPQAGMTETEALSAHGLDVETAVVIRNDQAAGCFSCTASAQAFMQGLGKLGGAVRNVVIHNRYTGGMSTLITLKCL